MNPLIVYYSYSGITRKLAEDIALITDGELQELEPQDPYSPTTSFYCHPNRSTKMAIRRYSSSSKKPYPTTPSPALLKLPLWPTCPQPEACCHLQRLSNVA